MKYEVTVLRHPLNATVSYDETFVFETEDENLSIADLLESFNAQDERYNSLGKPCSKIAYKLNCLQKKCGACAMLINGKPALACGVRLKECGTKIRLEPLKKFPVVEDLIVDRDIMRKNLRDLKVWFEDDAGPGKLNLSYEASRCLQCGCCLEVCPNFASGFEFTGMAGAMPMGRILDQLPAKQKDEARHLYRAKVYEGCGKSLACRNVCPAGLDIEKILSGSNAIAVWNRYMRRKNDEKK